MKEAFKQIRTNIQMIFSIHYRTNEPKYFVSVQLDNPESNMLCGYESFITFTEKNPKKVTCPKCLELLKARGMN